MRILFSALYYCLRMNSCCQLHLSLYNTISRSSTSLACLPIRLTRRRRCCLAALQERLAIRWVICMVFHRSSQTMCWKHIDTVVYPQDHVWQDSLWCPCTVIKIWSTGIRDTCGLQWLKQESISLDAETSRATLLALLNARIEKLGRWESLSMEHFTCMFRWRKDSSRTSRISLISFPVSRSSLKLCQLHALSPSWRRKEHRRYSKDKRQ